MKQTENYDGDKSNHSVRSLVDFSRGKFISRPVSAVHLHLRLLLCARVIGFLFKIHGERFAVGDERWPVKVSLRDHRQVGVDGFSNGLTRIPESAERQSKGRGVIHGK